MRIKYVWHDEPNREREVNTVHEFLIMPSFLRPDTQEECDRQVSKCFDEWKKKGLVLRYTIEGGDEL